MMGVILTVAGDILLVRQFRPPLGHDTLECPAGGLGPGEDPLEAMIRELHEETGHSVRGWRRWAASG
ncbi:MAG: NUDIX hydrolase [Caulobacter sp.]|nr:NUDIX hydrolase [Caulobacter sp.]